MSKVNFDCETIASIVAEMREATDDLPEDALMHVGMLDNYADRIEAAWNRGNAAPTRNCDRFKTAKQAWSAYCKENPEAGVEGHLSYEVWLFAPYEYRTPKPALDVVMAQPDMTAAKDAQKGGVE